jgi:hypothetical protein
MHGREHWAAPWIVVLHKGRRRAGLPLESGDATASVQYAAALPRRIKASELTTARSWADPSAPGAITRLRTTT